MKVWGFYDTLTDMSSLSNGKSNFDEDISGWDVSRVTNMYAMFQGATAFNQDIGGWDVSRVANMQNMFKNASERRLGPPQVGQGGAAARRAAFGSDFESVTRICMPELKVPVPELQQRRGWGAGMLV